MHNKDEVGMIMAVNFHVSWALMYWCFGGNRKSVNFEDHQHVELGHPIQQLFTNSLPIFY